MGLVDSDVPPARSERSSEQHRVFGAQEEVFKHGVIG